MKFINMAISVILLALAAVFLAGCGCDLETPFADGKKEKCTYKVSGDLS